MSENPDGFIPPADVLLSDGTIAVIRPLRTDDAEPLHELHQRVSDESLRRRFFSVGRAAAHEYVDHLLRDRPLTLVVERERHVLAVATAEPMSPDVSEVSFLVEDGRHGLGIGSLLLEHLAAAARSGGVATFVAEVLLENRAMLGVLSDAGFTVTRQVDDGVVDVRLDTRMTATGQAVADARDRRAEARSLDPLFHPRSVAVAGVRSDGQGIGRAVLDNIRAGDFSGRLHVVHPRASVLDGVPAVASFKDIPGRVDLAVIAVPAERVLAVVADAADARVPVAVVISSGFQELGDEGARLQRDLAELARSRSIRLVGPNCLGVMSNDPAIRLNATFTACIPPSGGLAVATQSGGVGIVFADLARELGLGIGTLVSLGNKVDVSSNDLLAIWTDDPAVTAGALYLESFGNARKFARIARRFSERKPLMAVVGGRSDSGRRAGASHTAAAATPAVGVAALYTHSRGHRLRRRGRAAGGDRAAAHQGAINHGAPPRRGEQCRRHGCARGRRSHGSRAGRARVAPDAEHDRGTRTRYDGLVQPGGRRGSDDPRRAGRHRRDAAGLGGGRRPCGDRGAEPFGP